MATGHSAKAATTESALLMALAGPLLPLFKEAVREVLREERMKDERGAQALSASKAARLAGCRDSYLLQALASGALPGRKKGARWGVLASDCAEWVRRGKPIERVA